MDAAIAEAPRIGAVTADARHEDAGGHSAGIVYNSLSEQFELLIGHRLLLGVDIVASLRGG